MVDAIIYYSLNTHPTACVLLTAPPHLVSLILSLSLSLSVISSAFTDFDFECCRTRLKIKVKKKKQKKNGLDWTELWRSSTPSCQIFFIWISNLDVPSRTFSSRSTLSCQIFSIWIFHLDFPSFFIKKKKNVAEIDIDLGASEPGPPVKTR